MKFVDMGKTPFFHSSAFECYYGAALEFESV